MALENILSQEIVQKLGWTLLHFVWQAAAIALLLAIVLAMLRKSTANLRYIVACAALGLIVLLPMVTIPLVQISTSQPMVNIEPRPAPVIVPMQPTAIETPLAGALEYEESAQPESVSPAPAVPWKQRSVELLEPALPYLVGGWLLGVFGLSIWHLGGWAQLQRLRKKMVKQVDAPLRAKLSRLSQRLGVKRAVQLVESALVQVPTVVGWLRPVILLPASALTGLSSEQLEALLAHELAHIRRYDYLVNMLQTIVETLGFYHPAVWWISHKIRIERENCCDDLAVSISGDRIRYAKALTSMEEIRGRRGGLAVAAAGGNLFSRIRRLVGKDSTDRSRTSWIPSAITILLIAIIAIPTTLALTGQNKTQPSAESLLDKMLEHRSRVGNLQYIAENHIWRDPAAEEVQIEEHIKRMREQGMSERQLERVKQSLSQVPENRYQILKCTVDDAGHSKIELTTGTYDSSGKKVPNNEKMVWTWNGVQATDFSQRGESPGSATIKDTPQMATRLWHPWRSLTGILCQFLQETIAAEKPVSVDELQDGTFRVAFDYKISRYAAIVDPSKGYTCSLQETYDKQGQLNSRTTTTYEEVTKGIWFPVGGQREEYTAEGDVRYRSIFKSSQIRINDPAFNAGYFNVNMPKGTHVRDFTSNAEQPEIYRYGEPRKNYDELVRSGSKFVAGSVIDENGSPVPGVRVEVCGHKKARADGKFSWIFSGEFEIFNAVTDDQGHFAIELQDDGFYNLRFQPENYAAIMAYDVPVGKKDLKVTLPEGGTISGRLVRVEGGRKVPIPSVEVKAEQSDRGTYSHLGFNRDRKTMTDSQGRFRFDHLRTKMRSPETRHSEQWQYSPRPWTISYEKTSKTVLFYEGARTEEIELVVEPDYTNPGSLIGKPLSGLENNNENMEHILSDPKANQFRMTWHEGGVSKNEGMAVEPACLRVYEVRMLESLPHETTGLGVLGAQYGQIEFSDFGQTKFTCGLRKSSEQVVGYDEFFIDLNNNGRLDKKELFKGQYHDSTMGPDVVDCHYGPIDLTLSDRDGQRIHRVFAWYHMLHPSRPGWLYLNTHCYLDGRIRLGDRRVTAVLVDYNCDGRYDSNRGEPDHDRIGWDADGDGKIQWTEQHFIGSYLVLEEGVFRVGCTPDGQTVAVVPVEVPMGRLQMPAQNIFVRFIGDTGPMNLRITGGAIDMPAGTYRVNYLHIDETNDNGEVSRLRKSGQYFDKPWEIRAGVTTKIDRERCIITDRDKRNYEARMRELRGEGPQQIIASLLDEPLRNLSEFNIDLDPEKLKSRRIVICFWDMDQRPSRNLVGELAKREKELRDKGVEVLLVHTSDTEPAKLEEWFDKNKIPFACGSIQSDDKEILFRWGVQAKPWLVLTDEEGIVRAEGFGLEQLDEKLQESSADQQVGKENEQLNNILEKFTNGASGDKPGNNSKSVRESMETQIAAAVPERAMLTMAIVPNIDGAGREPSLTKEEYQRRIKSLAQDGPFAGSIRGESFRWAPVKGDIDRFQRLPLSIYKEQPYILLCASARYVMIPEIESRRIWGLEKVQADTDTLGRTSIRIQFDEKGAELFYNLTKTNIGNHLAMIIDGQVLSAPRIETTIRKSAIITGDFSQHEILKLMKNLQKGMVIIPDVENKTKHEQLNDILKKFSDGTSTGKPDNNSKSVRKSVEGYIAAALADENEKAAEYAYPDTAVAAQTEDMREVLQGQNTRIVGMCIGEWNSLAISSVIHADGMTGSLVFHLKKMILDQKVHWLIDDIDIKEIDTVGEQIHYFINNVPNAKTIIINPHTYTNKQSDVSAESDNSGQTTAPDMSMLAKSATPYGADKSIIKIECRVGEAFSEPKMDRETITEIKNLLGDKMTIPDSPVAADLLRKAAKATTAVNDESAGYKRVSQEQFNTLVDLLLSRGFVKILMNPTLKVREGQTAQVKTDLNSLEVTANIAKDDIIYLTVQADLSSRSIPEGEEQKPIITTRSFATAVRVSPGECEIISGMKHPGLITEAGKDTQNSKVHSTETLVILTANIVEPAAPRQPPSLLGSDLPELKSLGITGQLDNLNDRRILLCFWDMNQRPSRNLIGELAKREKELVQKNFTVMLLQTSDIEPEELTEWLDNQNVPFVCGNIEGDAKEVLLAWGVQAQPWLILADEEGVVRAEGFDIKQLDEKLQEASKPTTAGIRIVHFPQDRAVGDLKVRNARPDLDWDKGYLSQPGWSLLGPAQGDVSIAEGEDLRLEVAGDVTDFSFLADLKPNDLKVLLLSGSKISDKDLVYLKGLKGLIALGMDSTHIENEWLAQLASLASLKELSLFDTQISDAGLEHLSNLKSLKRLNLFITKVRGPGLKYLQSLTSLITLDLAATLINDAALEHVGRMTWLKELQLQDTDITDKGLAHLKSLRSLEMLVLGYADLKQGYSPITDDGLVHLKELDSLEYLHLMRTHVTGSGLVHLKNLKALKTIKIAEIRFTAKDIEFLKKETGGLSDSKLDGEIIGDMDVKNLEMSFSDHTMSAETGRVNMLSPAPSSVDKSIVKIECLVGEAFSAPKMDRETIIAIENLLGGKITIPDSPAAADLLRKTAEATAMVKDKRLTQEQFNNLVDLLLSRGFVKILINPTLEVVDGQTTTIRSSEDNIEDLIQITPTVRENGSIILHANLDLTLKSEEPNANQPPDIRRWKMTTSANIDPGQSWVVEGMKAAEKSSGTREQKSELLVILTPSIIPPDEQKEPMETVNFKNVEVRTIIEKLAAWTGKTIIPPDELMKQKITIYSPEPMPRSKAAAMILDALCSKGYTAEQTDDTIYLKPLPEEQPGTGKAKIQLEARIMTVGDEFLKEIGFDANSVPDINAWPEPKPSTVWSSDNLKTFNIALNDSNVDFLLKTARAHKDTKVLTAPRVTAWDRDTAEVAIAKEYNYTSGYSEPNRPADKPVPKLDTARLGTFLKITPQITPDKKGIIFIDFELEVRELQSVEDRMYKGKYPYQIPHVSVVKTRTQCLIPDGLTLLNCGHKITRQLETTLTVPILGGLPVVGGLFRSSSKVADTRMLLVMVKPSTDIKAPPKLQPIDPNDPLIKKLEEMFRRSDEQK